MPKFDEGMAADAIAEYGTTTNIRRTAFVMRDGAKITYRGTQYYHHADIARNVGARGVDDFLCRTGGIKLHDWKNERVVKACGYTPTKAQTDALKAFVGSSIRDPVDVGIEVVGPAKDGWGSYKYGGSCWVTGRPGRVDDVIACIKQHRKPAAPSKRAVDPVRRARSHSRSSGRPKRAIRFF
ncbi:MAG: hypothetical protein JSV86_17225 [Gemmatimonadota bacterium]|nr:MAG: hypothetical protein JSV86_17225 [Gemmatimonadota bacterium]